MTIPTAQKVSYRLLLTIPEAAQVLGVSRSILYQLVRAGEVATIKIGRSRRVPIVALEQYVRARLTPSLEGR
jgi:excisionase family DNA binding protein